jgi:integrase
MHRPQPTVPAGRIVQRTDGRWTAAISLGARRHKWFYGSSREEVHGKLTAALHALNTTGLADSRGLTVGEFLQRWLHEVAEPSVRPWTFHGYEVHIRLHIDPVLGRIPIWRLEPLQVQGLINRKLKKGLSPKTVRYIRGTLRSALNQAVRWGLVARNAAALVDGPRVPTYEIQPFEPDEARRFLDAAKGHRLEALYAVALTLGLRQGEALGLRWQDVDLQMGYLRVARQLQRFDGVFQLVEPKTARSRRTIVMPPSVTARLADHRDRQDRERNTAGLVWKEWGLVFTRPDGYPLDGTVVTHQFHRFLEQAGLPQRRFHDLRHSCAALLLAQGVSPRVVMEILGHSQIALTMNTYTHVVPDLRRDAAVRMEALLYEPER